MRASTALLAAALLAAAVALAAIAATGSRHGARAVPTPSMHATNAHTGAAQIPSAALGVVSSTLGSERAAYLARPSRTGVGASNPAQGMSVNFARSGTEVRAGDTRLAFGPAAIGFGSSLYAAHAVAPRAHANRVTYAFGDVQAWYRNGPLGLEQGFTVARAPAGATGGPLTIAVGLSGNVRASLASGGRGITFAHRGGPTLHYGDLSATDARGRALHSWLQLRNGALLLRVDARGAAYPLTIDPLLQQGSKLTGGGEAGEGVFGLSSAISANGKWVLVGGPADNNATGAVWAFTRSGATWVQQGSKITGGGEVGEAQFGYTLALSEDGSTALIGGAKDNGNGAVWVFTRSGSTFTQQGSKLTGSEEVGSPVHFGCCGVALSADGNTALVGGYGDNASVGAAWVFTRSGSTWTQQGPKLTAGGEVGAALFGYAVALSSDGNTALIGGGADKSRAGAAWVFTRSGSTWTQQGSKLTPSGETGAGQFGYALALSSDGNTALIAAGADNTNVGAAWTFTRSGSTWSQLGSKLTASEEIGEGHFGCCSVGLSGDGTTALIPSDADNAGVGAAWEFTRSGATWTQEGSKITGGEEVGAAAFGRSLALSAAGTTAVIGGFADNESIGAAWMFSSVAAPTAVTGTATEVAHASATLNATVNPEGETVTDCHFEYGTTESYGTSVPCSSLPGSGTTAVAVSANVSGLSASTTYHYRIVATNAVGTGHGADGTFETTPGLPPAVVTDAASAVAQTSATLNATVNPERETVSDCHFEYGTTESYGTSIPCSSLPGSGTSPVPVSANVTGLVASTTYHYRIVATNASGTSPGTDGTFTTSASEAPAVLTQAATNVAQTTATLNATVNPEDETVSDCHFEYGTTESYGTSIPCSSLPGSGTSPVPVSANVTGLNASTVYHYRIVATNPGGTGFGTDHTFETTASKPPVVVTGTATAVAQTTATLNATVDPEDETVSDCHFEYGTTESYGTSIPCSSLPGSGTSPVPVSANVTGLNPKTTYHFRIVATNPGGTSFGADGTFETLAEAPTAVTQAASRIGQNAAQLNASVNPNGGNVSDCHFEYGTTESYGTSVACSPSPGSGTSPVAVSASLSGLTANTSYHFRVVATNAGGTSRGADTRFTTATPTLPELGRCATFTKATFKYKSVACTILSTGENTGKFEWEPWPAAKNGFAGTGLAVTLTALHKASVKCTASSISGEYEGPQSASMTIVFTGCSGATGLAGTCQSEGAAAGEIRFQPLQAQLGIIKTAAAPVVGWDLKPASGPDLAAFACGASEVALTGSVIGQVTVVDKLESSFALKFKATASKQLYEKFEGGPKDTLSFVTKSGEEVAGLTVEEKPVNEEAIEIKAIV
jgi:phosphodiesterase/alkaline phosphatase D-like protein